MPFIASTAGAFGYGRARAAAAPTPSGPTPIIQLDAASSASYPGTGTTWFDISGTYNGALTNGPTYTGTGVKFFTFDGTDDYVNIADAAAIRPSIGGSVTGIIWAYITSYVPFDGLISKQFGSPSYDGFSLVFNTTERLQLNMNGQTVNGGYVSASTNVFALNTWTMFTCVVRFGGGAGNPSKAYVNTTEVISAANSESGIPSNTAPLRLVSGIQEGSPYPACRVGAFYYYNTALTAAQIGDIFTATRARYGI
jgi:hypothetical protein